ncbi:glutaminase [Pokkaliibacter sp. CJK22405]|uniref:glutaminase n=1 Tax=Pokkaliibacter sp. CJK22405 TaxID=3384615 RepID=UPI00398533BA
MDYPELLEEIFHVARAFVGKGKVADYIPALARVPAEKFGIAISLLDGREYVMGDADESFSIQSVSKVFSLALALHHLGDQVWHRVGIEPSGNPFNSLVQLEYENGIPRNPFINAGALVVTDWLLGSSADPTTELLDWLRAATGNPHIGIDREVADSEWEHRHRNAALTHFMASCGNIRSNVDRVLRTYFEHCAIAMSCRDLARAGLVLAGHGKSPRLEERFLTRSQAKEINALMLTCGTYDAAGDFAFRVGLPGKSGVGGGILAVIPNLMSIAVWSPALDSHGNSMAGVEALERFTTLTGISVF